MAERNTSLDEDDEPGLPRGVYINPDNLPAASPGIENLDDSIDQAAPARGHAKPNFKKVGELFKKGKEKLKIKKKDKSLKETGFIAGTSQLADVLGRAEGSSVASGGRMSASSQENIYSDEPRRVGQSGPRDSTEDPETKKHKGPRLSSFRELFHKGHKGHDDSTAYPTNVPRGTDPTDEPRGMQHQSFDFMRKSVHNFFHGPPAPSPPTSPDGDTELAPLKAPPPRKPCRTSVVLLIILSLIIIIGIFLTIKGAIGNDRVAEHCLMLGPCFIGLGAFTLMGQIFFMLFWHDDPLPMLNDTMAKINLKIGAYPDPYGHKAPPENSRASYYPGLRTPYMGMGSPTSPKEMIPMQTLQKQTSYPSSVPTGLAAFQYPSTRQSTDLGPAALDYSAPGGPASLGYSAPGGPAALAQDDISSYDGSIDSRGRAGHNPSPGIHNASYQEENEGYRPSRII